MRQVGNAFFLYAQDNNGRLPAIGSSGTDATIFHWVISLHKYTGSLVPLGDDYGPNWEAVNPIFICPEWPELRKNIGADPNCLGYALTASPIPNSSNFDTLKQISLSEIKEPSRTFLLREDDKDAFDPARIGESYLGNGVLGPLRHGSTANYLFMDGHVRAMTPEVVKANIPPSP